jgi:hypothetical protein
VPALFLFTMLFRGLARGLPDRAPVMPLRPLLVPALPMLALVGGATWLVQAQSALWPVLTAGDPDGMPTTVAVLLQYLEFDSASSDIGLGGPLPLPALLVFAAGLGVLQVLYLDRIAIRVGADQIPGR